jgi:hypothetical protein
MICPGKSGQSAILDPLNLPPLTAPQSTIPITSRLSRLNDLKLYHKRIGHVGQGRDLSLAGWVQ